MAGFSVVAMMRETPDVVQRFVDYYEALGATEVFVYFNGPAEELPPICGATRTNLDAAFWARNPDITLETIEDRMRVCYRDCLPRCRTPWLLVVDADEFVFADRPLTALLDSVPESVDAISFPTAEAVWGPGDDPDQPFGSTYFRTKWPSELQWRLLRRPIYGAVSSVMRWGVLGHVAGKHMLRTDRPHISIGGHRSMRGTESVTRPAASASKAFANAYVAHFDAIGLDRWERKWRGRIEKEVVAGGLSRLRQEQMEMVAAALKSGRTRALFRSFYGLSRGQSLVLSGLGHVFRREHFFDRAADYAAEPVRVPQSLRSKLTVFPHTFTPKLSRLLKKCRRDVWDSIATPMVLGFDLEGSRLRGVRRTPILDPVHLVGPSRPVESDVGVCMARSSRLGRACKQARGWARQPLGPHRRASLPTPHRA